MLTPVADAWRRYCEAAGVEADRVSARVDFYAGALMMFELIERLRSSAVPLLEEVDTIEAARGEFDAFTG